MRALYVSWRYPKLSETFVTNEALSLLAMGIDVRIISLRAPEQTVLPALAGRVQTLPLAALAQGLTTLPTTTAYDDDFRVRALTTGYGAAMHRLLGDWRPDVVHCHFVNRPAAPALELARRLDVPCTLVAHARDWIVDCSPRALHSKVSAAAHTFAISEHARTAILDKIGGVHAEKVSVLRASYRFAPGDLAPALPSRYLVLVARLVPKKGVDVAIKAIAGARAKGEAIPLVVVGDGPQRAELTRLIQHLGVAELVTLLGPRQPRETQRIIAGAYAMVLPCRTLADGDTDGIPVALMEAGAAAIAVVTTGVAGIGELVADGATGCLVRPDDPEDTTARITSLWHDPAERNRLAAGLHARVTEEFAPPVQAARLLERWSGLLTTPSRRA